ncbi:hypothetical protein Ltuc_0727 [Legionella tucsonensis]|uniref:Uncharacterized protein n=1 Tax=Legionella tucsonensis TaxID=40335 RepID=A0A0W0ZVP4_9GAMM|nr:hypothetical protein Ltuc_0727 [Legionella tucsonensis]
MNLTIPGYGLRLHPGYVTTPSLAQKVVMAQVQEIQDSQAHKALVLSDIHQAHQDTHKALVFRHRFSK